MSELLSDNTTGEEVLKVIRAVSPKYVTTQPDEAEKDIGPVGSARNDTVDEIRSNAKDSFNGV